MGIWAVPLLRQELVPLPLTPGRYPLVFGVWLDSEAGLPPLHHPVLYPQRLTPQASPKAISGRTSYLQPRLAFHPYPRVIQWLFNAKGFGPPSVFLRSSPCSGVDRLVSGLLWLPNTPYSDSVSLRLPTPLLTAVVKLGSHNNSPDHSSTGTPSPLIPNKSSRPTRARTACGCTVSGSISLPFRGSFHLSLTVLVALSVRG